LEIEMSVDLFAMIESVVAKVPGGVYKPLPAHRWDPVSINGIHSARVVDHGVSFDPVARLATVFWEFADLKDPTLLRTIRGVLEINGHAKIWTSTPMNGDVEQEHARIAARVLWTWQGIKISVEMIFDAGGKRQDYRFDGVTWP
jgi:hypothetical protein